MRWQQAPKASFSDPLGSSGKCHLPYSWQRERTGHFIFFPTFLLGGLSIYRGQLQKCSPPINKQNRTITRVLPRPYTGSLRISPEKNKCKFYFKHCGEAKVKIKFQPLMFPVSPCLPQYTIISCKHSEKTIVFLFPQVQTCNFWGSLLYIYGDYSNYA